MHAHTQSETEILTHNPVLGYQTLCHNITGRGPLKAPPPDNTLTLLTNGEEDKNVVFKGVSLP